MSLTESVCSKAKLEDDVPRSFSPREVSEAPLPDPSRTLSFLGEHLCLFPLVFSLPLLLVQFMSCGHQSQAEYPWSSFM